MKIHEFQAKVLFREYGIPVPEGQVAESAEGVAQAATTMGCPVVVKAQIHAGGRGKGGGVKVAKSVDAARAIATDMLGMQLKTHQTGPEGQTVRRVLVEQGLDIAQELYVGIVVDRSLACPVIMASRSGGMEIEEVAARDPNLIIKAAVPAATGFSAMHARKIAFGLGLDAALIKPVSRIVAGLYRLFQEKDCSLIEINPLVLTASGECCALDGKINFDDDALYRHPELKELFDPDEQDPLEREAAGHKLNYIKLDGNVGCMVNGAGLAMATMDLVKHAGAEPANFLDVGGGASAEQVENAFRILLADPNVKAVLVNIFGGILRCDRVANGIVEAAKKIGVSVPIIIRLEGTNVEEARQILQQSGLRFEVATSFADAATKVAGCVAAAA